MAALRIRCLRPQVEVPWAGVAGFSSWNHGLSLLPELTRHTLVVRDHLRLTRKTYRVVDGCGGFHHCFPAVDDEPDPPCPSASTESLRKVPQSMANPILPGFWFVRCLVLVLSQSSATSLLGLPLLCAQVKDLHLELSASFQARKFCGGDRGVSASDFRVCFWSHFNIKGGYRVQDAARSPQADDANDSQVLYRSEQVCQSLNRHKGSAATPHSLEQGGNRRCLRQESDVPWNGKKKLGLTDQG